MIDDDRLKILAALSRGIILATTIGLVFCDQFPLSAEVSHPSIFNLPRTPEEQETRLEVRLSLRQVVLYRGTTEVKSYPIAIGKRGAETPTGNFHITQLIRNPTWRNPWTHQTIPSGHPNNPLGRYWIGFSTEGEVWYGFHGTSNSRSIGKAISHGCIRMHNQDIEELFSLVHLGNEVKIIP